MLGKDFWPFFHCSFYLFPFLILSFYLCLSFLVGLFLCVCVVVVVVGGCEGMGLGRVWVERRCPLGIIDVITRYRKLVCVCRG